jgi:hypothetical protein
MVTKLKKKKPTRKRKVLPVEQLEEMAREEAEKFKVLADRRGRMAKAAYAAQDKATREVLDAIRDRLLMGANGLLRIQPPNAQPGDVFAVEMGMEFLEQNALFMATEILKDFALFDIRVERYKFPKNRCADCGKKIKDGG